MIHILKLGMLFFATFFHKKVNTLSNTSWANTHYQGPYVKHFIGEKEATAGEDYSFTINPATYFGWTNETNNLALNMSDKNGKFTNAGFHFTKISNGTYLFLLNGSSLYSGQKHDFILIASNERGTKSAQLWKVVVATKDEDEDDANIKKQIRDAVIFASCFIGTLLSYLVFIYCRDKIEKQNYLDRVSRLALGGAPTNPKNNDDDEDNKSEENSEKSTDPSISTSNDPNA